MHPRLAVADGGDGAACGILLVAVRLERPLLRRPDAPGVLAAPSAAKTVAYVARLALQPHVIVSDPLLQVGVVGGGGVHVR